ncbi:MAG: hypothetical protein IT559_06385 [Alphaproteobacteria bacterium]|nr:hypothetical protein [Alphaproteobacteria bacterium]
MTDEEKPELTLVWESKDVTRGSSPALQRLCARPVSNTPPKVRTVSDELHKGVLFSAMSHAANPTIPLHEQLEKIADSILDSHLHCPSLVIDGYALALLIDFFHKQNDHGEDSTSIEKYIRGACARILDETHLRETFAGDPENSQKTEHILLEILEEIDVEFNDARPLYAQDFITKLAALGEHPPMPQAPFNPENL